MNYQSTETIIYKEESYQIIGAVMDVGFSNSQAIDFFYFQVDNTGSIVCNGCVCDLIEPFSSKPVQKLEAIKC